MYIYNCTFSKVKNFFKKTQNNLIKKEKNDKKHGDKTKFCKKYLRFRKKHLTF